MKTRYIIAILAIAGMGISANAGIENSKHDFSQDSWSGGEICVVCHTPHGGQTTSSGPLWNRSATTNLTFTMYDSTSLSFDPTGNTPGNESMACLSCHDGSVALDNFGGSTTGTTYIAATHNVGGSGDLGSEHPIGFAFDATLASADSGLHNPTNSAVSALLFSGQMECASCHDVHNDLGVAGLLRVDNAGSGLCLTCHNK